MNLHFECSKFVCCFCFALQLLTERLSSGEFFDHQTSNMFENALINRRRRLATQLFLSLQETKPHLFLLLPLPPGRKKQQRHAHVVLRLTTQNH
jgi:hypothetical protein